MGLLWQPPHPHPHEHPLHCRRQRLQRVSWCNSCMQAAACFVVLKPAMRASCATRHSHSHCFHVYVRRRTATLGHRDAFQSTASCPAAVCVCAATAGSSEGWAGCTWPQPRHSPASRAAAWQQHWRRRRHCMPVGSQRCHRCCNGGSRGAPGSAQHHWAATCAAAAAARKAAAAAAEQQPLPALFCATLPPEGGGSSSCRSRGSRGYATCGQSHCGPGTRPPTPGSWGCKRGTYGRGQASSGVRGNTGNPRCGRSSWGTGELGAASCI